jgi:MFS family permease
MRFKANIPKMYFIQLLLSFQLIAAVTVPFFRNWGGLDFTQILLLQSWFMAWIFILSIPSGAIADRIGRKMSLAIGCFILSIGAIVYSSIPNFFVFMAAEFIWGMGTAFSSGSDNALIYDTLKKDGKISTAKKVFARYGYVGWIGIIIASPIGSYIAGFDIRLTMMLTAIPMFIGGLVCLTLKEPPYKSRKTHQMKYLQIIKNGIKILRQSRILQILTIDAALANLIFYFIMWFWQPMMQKGGLNIIYWGVILAAAALVQIGMAEKVDWFEKIFGSKKFLILSVAISGILMLIGGFTNYLPILVAVFFLIMGFSATRTPLLVHYSNKIIPSEQRATTLSTISMISRFFIIIANPLVGISLDLSLNNTLIIVGIFGIIFGIISIIRLEGSMFEH